MYLSLLLPDIFSPTCTTVLSATFKENILTNNYNSSSVLGNLVNSLPDHHALFPIIENQHSSL